MIIKTLFKEEAQLDLHPIFPGVLSIFHVREIFFFFIVVAICDLVHYLETTCIFHLC